MVNNTNAVMCTAKLICVFYLVYVKVLYRHIGNLLF